MITRPELSEAAWRVIERELSLCADCSTGTFHTVMRQGAPVLNIGHDPDCVYVRHPKLRWLATEWIIAQLALEGVPVADYGDSDLVGAHTRVRRGA